MELEEFRRRGKELIDWIADYWQRIEEFPVLARAAPGELRAALPAAPPEEPEPFAAVMADVERLILPGITHWQSPGFFAYFPANVSPPSVLGELLAAGLGVQGMLWATSPACTELETHVLDWLVGLLGLPERFLSTGAGGGVIQDTASSATLCALLAARARAGGPAPDLVVYGSDQAHSSLAKAARIAGFAAERLRLLPAGAGGRLEPAALAAALAADRAAGLRPCFLGATVGTTSSHAVDPVRELGHLAREHGVWLHVDAAHAGTAALCEEFRWLHDGLELADSYCFNPHKWMFTNFDCDCFWVADREPLLAALSILPEYLRNPATESGAVIDYRDWQVPLGRRFRALKLWFVLRCFGARGLRAAVRRHVALAREFAGWVREDPAWELAAEPPLNLVCFRHRGGDERNQRILEAVNTAGRVFLTHTRLDDRFTLRLSVGQTHTERRHVELAWRELRAAAAVVG
ncbi:MAG: aminotransferase class V-fold PLP-dependent enzyme [Planctomycetota bacterium]|nr:MAG: aminotransferase class V-fold PLP-dependent enzyme [Planctomycetota bacterium]